VTNFPARKRMISLSDHGAGWPGGWGDPDPGGDGDDDVALVEYFGDSLWLMEIDRALAEARANLGIEAFDVIGFDACLMAQLEVFTAIAPHGLFAVASEETEPALGWAYAAFLDRLASDPGMDGAGLTTAIVETYIDEDLRLLDPSFAGGLSPEAAAIEVFYDGTLSAIDLTQIAPLNAALDSLAGAMTSIDQNIVAQARAYAQSYESVFGDDLPSPYIDLGHFAQLVQSNTQDEAVQDAAAQLETALAAAVIAERHGPGRPGSTGIAFYFPVIDLYRIDDNLGYSEVAARFAQESQWDEFLAFHLGGAPAGSAGQPASPIQAALNALMPDLDAEYVRILEDEIAALVEDGAAPEEIAQILVDEWELDEEVVVALLDAGLLGTQEAAPPANTTQRKPIQISPITLSAEVAYPGEPVRIEANVSGDRIGFIYSFIGRLLPEDDILIIEDEDFLFADEETTVGGVTYPVWPTE
ncbi:MAG: clostripain-related cysteine peptidase, partial [Caldilineaceae bacterium]